MKLHMVCHCRHH